MRASNMQYPHSENKRQRCFLNGCAELLSAKILDQHQVTAALIQAGTEKPTVIRRDSKSRPFHNQFPLHGNYCFDLFSGKVEELNIGAATALDGVEKIDSLRRHGPMTLRGSFKHTAFLAACDGDVPDAVVGGVYVIKDKLSIEGFKRLASAILRDLRHCPAFRRNLPDLPAARAVGAEVNPFAIA